MRSKRRMGVVLFALLALAVSPAKSLQDKASTAYRRAEFVKAAVLYKQLIDKILSDDTLRGEETNARKRLVLSLYNSDQKGDAVAQYKILKQRFPLFRLDPDEVLDETIAYLEAQVPNEAPAADPSPPETAPVSDAPRVVASAPMPPQSEAPTEAKRWRWYYLAPFGIGQYLAGSPVRGTIFLVLQTGFLVANIVTAVLFNQLRADGGGFNDPTRASQLQVGMNVSFFGAIGTAAAGILDGAIFEQ